MVRCSVDRAGESPGSETSRTHVRELDSEHFSEREHSRRSGLWTERKGTAGGLSDRVEIGCRSSDLIALTRRTTRSDRSVESENWMGEFPDGWEFGKDHHPPGSLADRHPDHSSFGSPRRVGQSG